MTFAMDASNSSGFKEGNSLSNNVVSPDVLRNLLARLEDMEERIVDISKAIESVAGPVPTDSEDKSGEHVKNEGAVSKPGVEENEDRVKDNQGVMSKPSNVSSETTVKASSKTSYDPRYKYTEITASDSSKTEKPRERPKITVPPNENSDTSMEYEIRFSKDSEKEEKREYFIKSLRLKSLMWTAVRGWIQHCGSDKDWDNGELLPLRPLVILHHWDQLQSLAETSDDATEEQNDTRRSLKHLLEDVKTIDWDEYGEFKGLRDLEMTQYNSMHYLFGPGKFMVASPFMDLPQIFQVDSCQYETEREQGMFQLSVWAYDWDGDKLLRRPYRFSIDKFDGEKRISELPIYPVEFFVDNTGTESAPKTGWPALRRLMAERAEMFRKFCACKRGSQLFRYSGPALVLRSASDSSLTNQEISLRAIFFGFPDRQNMPQQNIDEEIIVDPSCFITHGSEYAQLGEKRRISGEAAVNCKDCATQRRQDWIQSFPNVKCGNKETQDANHFDDRYDHFMLLPSRVLGFLLGRKQWAQFRVEHIHEISKDGMNADIESQLSLPKDLNFKSLKNMVKSHSRVVNATGQSSMRDPINGKGNGLVLLFHGPTGVGKTLTAEVLANVADMPLYKAGISEIGTTPKEAEKGMRHLFDLAQAWNALLLIDEADVFLDSRGSMGEADLEKNAMVAVLLREIEYFSGILIMTTNRVMTFDVAMLSRIHWPINFGYLTAEQEENIWKIWRTKWKTENEKELTRSNGDFTQGDVDSHLKQFDMWRENSQMNQDPSGLNGREIRNIFLGARTMANGGFVEWEFVKTCYANTIRFRKEMRERQLTVESTLIAGVNRRQ